MNENTFINPYNFIPVSGNVERQPVSVTLEKFSGFSGRLDIRLKTLTPLFIPDRAPDSVDDSNQNRVRYKRFLSRDPLATATDADDVHKIIPGASLKGMLRSVAEALSESCFLLDLAQYDDVPVDFGEYTGKKCGFQTTSEERKLMLCPCCRLFGGIAQEGSDSEEGGFKGRVAVSDAHLAISGEFDSRDKIDATPITLPGLATPKVKHKPFYFEDYEQPTPKKFLGRKFYYHFYPDFDNMPMPGNRRMVFHQTIREGAFFSFTVDFENLQPAELALLLLAIRLNGKAENQPDFMAHKVGMAKPLGFGSVHLRIARLLLKENGAAYGDFGNSEKEYTPTTNPSLAEKIAALLKNHHDPIAKNPARFQLWHFPRVPRGEGAKVHYPDLITWFKRDLEVDAQDRVPLRPEGLLPDPWKEGSVVLEEKEVEHLIQERMDRALRVKVIRRTGEGKKRGKGNEVIVEVDGQEHEVFCPRKTIQVGDEILVLWNNDKGKYVWQPEKL